MANSARYETTEPSATVPLQRVTVIEPEAICKNNNNNNNFSETQLVISRANEAGGDYVFSHVLLFCWLVDYTQSTLLISKKSSSKVCLCLTNS